jgi:hypothetical protein
LAQIYYTRVEVAVLTNALAYFTAILIISLQSFEAQVPSHIFEKKTI